jgi:hypothetical protein
MTLLQEVNYVEWDLPLHLLLLKVLLLFLFQRWADGFQPKELKS